MNLGDGERKLLAAAAAVASIGSFLLAAKALIDGAPVSAPMPPTLLEPADGATVSMLLEIKGVAASATAAHCLLVDTLDGRSLVGPLPVTGPLVWATAKLGNASSTGTRYTLRIFSTETGSGCDPDGVIPKDALFSNIVTVIGD